MLVCKVSMMLTHSTSTKSMFMLGTMSTTLLMLLVNNWLMMWLSMELNLMFLIPVLMKMEEMSSLETSIKYFLFQSIGSHVFILSMLWAEMSTAMSKYFLILATMMKWGGAPCHQWFPPLLNSQPWVINLLLSTTQKLPMLLILTFMFSNWDTKLITFLITLNVMVGSLGGLNQSQLKTLLAYSSVNNIGWLLLGGLVSSEASIIYFSIYLGGMSLIVWNFHYTNKSNSKQSQQLSSSWNTLSMSILFIMSLWGSPPFIGFTPKMMMLSYVMNPLHTLSVILIISSMISLFYYGMIFLMMTMKQVNEKTIVQSSSDQLSMVMILLSTSLLTPLLLQ